MKSLPGYHLPLLLASIFNANLGQTSANKIRQILYNNTLTTNGPPAVPICYDASKVSLQRPQVGDSSYTADCLTAWKALLNVAGEHEELIFSRDCRRRIECFELDWAYTERKCTLSMDTISDPTDEDIFMLGAQGGAVFDLVERCISPYVVPPGGEIAIGPDRVIKLAFKIGPSPSARAVVATADSSTTS